MKKKILVVIANYYTNIADELLKNALNELKNIHQKHKHLGLIIKLKWDTQVLKFLHY